MAITDLPSYWQDEINASVRTIKSNIDTIRASSPGITPRTSTFFFITDMHWRDTNVFAEDDKNNPRRSPTLALELANAIDSDITITSNFKTRANNSDYRRLIFAGDCVRNHGGTKDQLRGLVNTFYNSWDSSFHVATALGNHDTNREGSNSSVHGNILDYQQPYGGEIYDLYFARETNYVVRDNDNKDSFIGWFDDTANKIRYFTLRHYGKDDLYQETWTKLENALEELSRDISKSWGAIFFCHCWWGSGGVTYDSNIAFAKKLADLCCQYRVIPIALMTGHIHRNRATTITSTSGNSILVVSTQCDWWYGVRTDEYTPKMTKNTSTEQAFEFVQVDVNNYKLYLTRIGSGSDRVLDIPVPSFIQFPILFIGAGTSGMQGYTEVTESGDISVENAWYWDYYNNEWKTPVKDPTGVNNQRGSIVPAFLYRLRQAYPLRKFLFINAGKGGSTVSSDLASDVNGNWSIEGNLLNRLDTMVGEAITAWGEANVVNGGIIWYGGGNDYVDIANNTTDLATYETSFRNTLLYLHNTYNSNIYLIGISGDPSLSETNQAIVDNIRQIQDDVLDEHSWSRKVADNIIYRDDPNYWTGYGGSHLGQAAIDALGMVAATNILYYDYLGEAMSLKFINLQNLTDFWDNAKAWVNAKDYVNHTELATVNNSAVHLTGDQTIAGNKTFTDGITANVTGTSERAAKDANGNVIDTTYATKDEATISAKGLMSAADKAKLDGIASALTFKGSVADDTSFPASDNVAGDTYLNEDDGHLYAYDGTDWTDLGLIAFTSMTNAEVDAVFEE